MKVKNSVICELLVALGVDTAKTWGAGKTIARITGPYGFSKYVPDDWPTMDLSDDHKALIKKLLAQQEKEGTKLEIEDDKAPVRQRDRHPVKPATPRQVYPPGWAKWPNKKRMAYWAKHPRPLPVAGVASVVIRELVRAGLPKRPRPVTKRYLLEVLREEFPERDDVGMQTNVNNLVPSRLRDVYGLIIERVLQPGGELGFYVLPAGREPAE